MVGQLSGGCLYWGKLLEANCPAGKSPEDNYPWGKFHGSNCLGDGVTGALFKVNCLENKSLGGNCPGGVSLGVILCGREVWGLIFLGGISWL